MATYTGTGTNIDNGSGGKDKAEAKKEQIKEQVKGLVDAGQDKLNDVKESLIEAKGKVADRAQGFANTLREQIKARPLTTVAVAFGIGFVVMRIFR
jgi:ElaB/YqjD/DUF883 family membrane-anchored ribosome-binding protein